MEFKHKNHLISAYLTFHKQLREIRDTICDGNPPSRTGAKLVPLPEDMQNEIIIRLEKVSDLFDEIAQKYVSAELENKDKRGSMSTTKMWASIQLRQIEENLSEIDPKTFGEKYGALEPEDQAYLDEIVNQIMQEIAKAEQII